MFRAAKDGSPTQFAQMARDLGTRLTFAGSPQAKGRVERYNGTARLRLPMDIVRFGVAGYDELNPWFKELYAPYLNTKLSYPPADPGTTSCPCPTP